MTLFRNVSRRFRFGVLDLAQLGRSEFDYLERLELRVLDVSPC